MISAQEIKEVLLSGNVLFLKGAPGKSKSAIAKRIAVESGWNYFDIRLSQKDETEVGGLPYRAKEYVKQDIDGENTDVEVDVLKYALPSYFVKAVQDGNNGKPSLIHYEELNRANSSVRNACLEILNERTLNGIKLPNNVYMMISGNLGDEDGCEVDELDSAVLNRIVPVSYDPTASAWIEEFASKNILEIIQMFIKSESKYYYYTTRDNNSEQIATPRSWTNFDKYLRFLYNKELNTREGVVDDLEKKSIMNNIILTMNSDIAKGIIGNAYDPFKKFAFNYLKFDYITLLRFKELDKLKSEITNLSKFHVMDIFETFLNNSAFSDKDKFDLKELTKENFLNLVYLFNALPDDSKVKYIEIMLQNFDRKELFKHEYFTKFFRHKLVIDYTKRFTELSKGV